MTTALTLPEAAGLAFDNLQVWWLIPGTQLKNRLNAFWSFSLSLFPDSDPKGRPVANWLTLLAGLERIMANSQAPIEQLSAAAQYVYRACWMAQFLRTSGQISVAQANNLLGNYNGNLAAP